MTDNQFSTYSFRHSEIIVYHQQHPDEDVECMLIGVNFDHGLFHLVPFDQEIYEDISFWIPYKFCDKKHKKPKMKIIRCNDKIAKK